MTSNIEFPINTGNPDLDRQQLAQMEQQYAAAGMTMQATPLPGGGFHVRVMPAGAQPPMGAPGPMPGPGGYGAPPAPMGSPPGGYGAPPGPMGAPPGGFGGPPGGAPPMGSPPGGFAPPDGAGAPQFLGAPPGGFGGPVAAAPSAPVVMASGRAGGGLLASPKVMQGAAVGIGIVAAALMFVMPDMGVGVIAGIAAAIALVLAVALALVAKPKVLTAIGAVGVALLVGGGGGAGMWFLTHPSVHVDNASRDPVEIFVDGSKELSLAADSHGSIFVHKGKHEFGWARKGAKKPEGKVDGEVAVMKEHLYNPGKSACYWLQVDVYGAASSDGEKAGPLKIAEFYRFDKVNNWFTENPEFVTVKKSEGGKVQVALQRARACMEFATCGLAVREKLVACQRAAFTKDDEEAFKACGEQAAQSCADKAAEGGGTPSESPSASPSAAPKAPGTAAKTPTTPAPPAATPKGTATTAPKPTATTKK